MKLVHSISLICMIITAQMAWAHGDELPTGARASVDHFSVYGQSDRYELSLYYPELKAKEEAHFLLFLADYFSNKAIDKATIQISIPGNSKIKFPVEAISPGVYEFHGAFPENKKYNLNVQINHPNGADLIGLNNIEVGALLPSETTDSQLSNKNTSMPNWLIFIIGLSLGAVVMYIISRRKNRALTVFFLCASAWFSNTQWNPLSAHGDEDHSGGASGNSFGKTVSMPKETQFLFEVYTDPLSVGDYSVATTMYGTVLPSSEGLGNVIATQNGRLLKVNVKVGQMVKAGQTLAVLQQIISTPDQVNITANNSGLDLQIETARTKVETTKRELDRLKKIEDIAAAKEVQAAEAAYKMALVELQTLEKKSNQANTNANNRIVNLSAPISGVVGQFSLSAGAEVVAGQSLFVVTNLSKVYVEAQVFDKDLPAIKATNKFTVLCSSNEHKSAEVRLISQAQTMNSGNQSQKVLFEMDNPGGDFKIGEFVSVKALAASISRQIAVPNSAITEINGKAAIFYKRDPEFFEMTYVKTGEDDGTHTIVSNSILEGKRIVTNGTYEVKMIYLNQ